MISSRRIEESDKELLACSLAHDEYHKETTPDFFYDPMSLCNVYEDENGPVCFVRGTKALRLDIQYVSNVDVARNRAAMLAGFEQLAQRAREAGFSELVFNTDSRALRVFCKRHFHFEEVDGELRKHL